MKAKIYTAALAVDCVNGKTPINETMECASFPSADDRQKWLDEKYCEYAREYGEPDKDFYAYETLDEREIDIPVFVTVNVDYLHTDENCGLMTEAFPTRAEAAEHLKESVREEIEAGTIDANEIDWHHTAGRHGIENMPDEPEIADTERFGWTIEEY